MEIILTECATKNTCLTGVRLVQDGKILAEARDDWKFDLVVEGGWSGEAVLEFEGCEKAEPLVIEASREDQVGVSALIGHLEPDRALTIQWSGSAEGRTAYARAQGTTTLFSTYQSYCHEQGNSVTLGMPNEGDAPFEVVSYFVSEPEVRTSSLGRYRIWNGQGWRSRVYLPWELDDGVWSLSAGVTAIKLGLDSYDLLDTKVQFTFAGDEPLVELSGGLARIDGELFTDYIAFSLAAGVDEDEVRIFTGLEWYVATAPHISVVEAFQAMTSTAAILDYGELEFVGINTGSELSLKVFVQLDSFPVAQGR